jgi:hypothetical protein
MRTILSLILFCVLLPTAMAQGNVFTNILRSVTGTVGNSDAPAKPAQTATLGVRGMDDGDVKTAAPAGDGVKQIEGWAVGRKEAEAAAVRRGLTARAVEYENVAADKTNLKVPQ